MYVLIVAIEKRDGEDLNTQGPSIEELLKNESVDQLAYMSWEENERKEESSSSRELENGRDQEVILNEEKKIMDNKEDRKDEQSSLQSLKNCEDAWTQNLKTPITGTIPYFFFTALPMSKDVYLLSINN